MGEKDLQKSDGTNRSQTQDCPLRTKGLWTWGACLNPCGMWRLSFASFDWNIFVPHMLLRLLLIGLLMHFLSPAGPMNLLSSPRVTMGLLAASQIISLLVFGGFQYSVRCSNIGILSDNPSVHLNSSATSYLISQVCFFVRWTSMNNRTHKD